MACQRQGPQSRKSVWSRSWWSIRCHRGCRMFLEHIPLGLEMSLGLNLLHGMFIKRLLLMHFLDMRLYSWPPSVLTSSVEVAIVFSPPPPSFNNLQGGRVYLLAFWLDGVRFVFANGVVEGSSAMFGSLLSIIGRLRSSSSSPQSLARRRDSPTIDIGAAVPYLFANKYNKAWLEYIRGTTYQNLLRSGSSHIGASEAQSSPRLSRPLDNQAASWPFKGFREPYPRHGQVSKVVGLVSQWDHAKANRGNASRGDNTTS